jgi:antitoxin YefM
MLRRYTIGAGMLYAFVRESNALPVETTYARLRERLASFLDQVANDREVVIVRRWGAKDVALVPAEELASLTETAHLLRSSRNAQRLLTVLQRATRGKGKAGSADKRRREMGLGVGR